jgi:hypothetical protein
MNPHAQEIPVIASQGRIGTASDPRSVQEQMAPVVPLGGRRRWHGHPTTSESILPCAQTELPWRIQLASRPLPRLGPVDVVQAGLLVGLRAVEGARNWGLSVGPVLCCPAHARIHIPVEAGTAYRWHVPQTVCRAGRLWECALDSQVVGHSRCSTVWLLPPDEHPDHTDSATLLHWLALTRSGGTRNREELYGG